MGENPAAGETSGLSVNRTRYAAVLLGTALAGLGGAVLTVVQLRMFREASWRPRLDRGGPGDLRALAAEPGVARCIAVRSGRFDSIPHPGVEPGRPRHGHDPYEFLLMLPYILTLVVLWFRTGRGAAPRCWDVHTSRANPDSGLMIIQVTDGLFDAAQKGV